MTGEDEIIKIAAKVLKAHTLHELTAALRDLKLTYWYASRCTNCGAPVEEKQSEKYTAEQGLLCARCDYSEPGVATRAIALKQRAEAEACVRAQGLPSLGDHEDRVIVKLVEVRKRYPEASICVRWTTRDGKKTFSLAIRMPDTSILEVP